MIKRRIYKRNIRSRSGFYSGSWSGPESWFVYSSWSGSWSRSESESYSRSGSKSYSGSRSGSRQLNYD